MTHEAAEPGIGLSNVKRAIGLELHVQSRLGVRVRKLREGATGRIAHRPVAMQVTFKKCDRSENLPSSRRKTELLLASHVKGGASW